MIAARVIPPFFIMPHFLKNVSADHAFTSASDILLCTFLNIIRALAMATSSRSLIVASATICADQSVSLKIGSSRIALMRSVVISTRESSIRCHALLWANTGRLGRCLGIWITHTLRLVSSVINSSISRPSVERFTHLSVSRNIAFCLS